MKRFLINVSKFIVIVFAIIGFVLLAAYLGVNFHLTDTVGILDKQADSFWENNKVANVAEVVNTSSDDFFNITNYCLLVEIKKEYPGTFWRILNLSLNKNIDLAQDNLNVAVATLEREGVDTKKCKFSIIQQVGKKDFEKIISFEDEKSSFVLATSSEWAFFKMGVLKDREVIEMVEKKTGIKSRIIVSQLVAEQMRLFHSNRAWFEKAISPVKILASMSQFSWGVLGIKQETAFQIEKNLKDIKSIYYLGTEYENLLDFKTKDVKQERFKRITNYHDHYFGYLYPALYNKQIITQWSKNGIDISERPEILATLYNIGFKNSKPNEDPQMGGSELNLGGKKYSFGRLAYEFYYSGELIDEFPQ